MENLKYIKLEFQANGNVDIEGEKEFSQGYILKGEKGGIFLNWSFTDGRFTFNNDRYGMYPAFYYIDGNKFILSTSLDNLVNLVPNKKLSLDHEGLSVFLRLGWFIGDHTPFKEIKAVPADCKMTWQEGNLSIKKNSRQQVPPFKGNRTEAIREFQSLFQEAISDCIEITEGKLAVPLSGGRDSRHILLELKRQKKEPDLTVTMEHIPPINNADAIAAKILTDKLNIPHTILSQPKSVLTHEWQKNILCNYSVLDHTWSFPMIDFFRTKKVDAIYDGIAGDVFSKSIYFDNTGLNLLKNNCLDDLARHILKRKIGVTQVGNSISPSSYNKYFPEELAISSISKEFLKYKNENNPINCFYFWNRTRRAIGSYTYGMLGSFELVFSPYLGDKLFDFFLSLTPGITFPNEIHSETIINAYPDYSDIPFEEKIVFPKKSKLFTSTCRMDAIRLFIKIALYKGNYLNKNRTLLRIFEAIITGNKRTFDYAGGNGLIYIFQLHSLMERNQISIE